MDKTIKKTWDLLKKTVDLKQKEYPEMSLNENLFNLYKDRFCFWYQYIKDNYMNNHVEYLDRHKVSGIIIVSLIECKAITYDEEKIPEGYIFIGQYLISLSIGLTYMQNRLNDCLLKKGKGPIDKIWMPECIFSCDNNYFEIISRNLYYSHTEDMWGLNPLDIARELFLLEYITVEKNGIDPNILKEKKKTKRKSSKKDD